jgi:HEAT repeat protein
MRDEIRFAVLLGRLIDLLRAPTEAVDDHKAALQALDDLVGRRSVSVRNDGGRISVEGVDVPRETPFVSRVAQQMDAHGLAAINVALGASAIDLLHAVRAIALSPANYPVNTDAPQRLRESRVSSILFVTKEAEREGKERRKMRLSEALERSGLIAFELPEGRSPELDVVAAEDGAAYDEMVRHIRASRASTLAGSVEGLRETGAGPKLMSQLEAVQAGVTRALRQNDMAQAMEAIVALIREEAAAESEVKKRSFAIAVRRVLTADTIDRLVPFLLDEIYAKDAISIVRRAGGEGTRIVMDRLVSAQTFAERKAYLNALREIEEGTDVIAGMLKHHEWFVVRNAADLAGELGIKEAVPLLGQVCEHGDARVRQAAAQALAKIGTPDAVRFLRNPLRDADRNVRLAVARAIKGRGLAGLAMVLVAAADQEEDPEVLAEYYRGLGRIGTPDAVRVLEEIAQAKGLFAGKKATERRLAATEGLALAIENEAARAALAVLSGDRDKSIRSVAKTALEPPSP